MKKTEDFRIVESSTGDAISKKEYISMIYKERALELKRVYELVEQDPSKLSVEDLRLIEKNERINFEKISTFDKYHSTNEDFNDYLLDNMSPRSYMAMMKIINRNCSMAYTLKFKNGSSITKDEGVANELNMTLDTWRRIKKELLDYNVLRVVEFEKKKYYKINPCSVGKKKIMTPNTYYAFRDELIKYNMITKFHVIYWDKLLKEEYGIMLGKNPNLNI